MRLTLSFILSLFVGVAFAQVPQGVGYQGVATDSEGIELVNQAISIRASILSGSVNGVVQWQEVHDTTTDDFGLFALTIGEGNNTGSGMLSSFADIPWGESTYFLQIEMDATGGMDYSLMGVNQMMSVPYALYAESTNLDYDSIANYLSGDSTFVTNVSNGLGGGECNLSYPDGLADIFPIHIPSLTTSSYTVPEGKNLYINNFRHSSTSSNEFFVNGEWVSYSDIAFNSPLIISSGSEITVSNVDDIPNLANSYFFDGFLVESSVEPVIHSFHTDGDFTVPVNKLFVFNYFFTNAACANLLKNGVIQKACNNLSTQWELPVICKEGDVISAEDYLSGEARLYGYLVDEDYFADCGGGGGSSDGEGGLIVETVTLDSSCRCWPDQGEVIVNLPDADIVYLDVEPYLNENTAFNYDTYNCFKFQLPTGTEYKSMTIIPPHLKSLIPPLGSQGDDVDALRFDIFANNFLGHLQYDGGIDSYSNGAHAGWHTWIFNRDHYGNWRPITTQEWP